ncbi:hypothetical protein PISMIDRAFT_685275, partial [Pisolithus microcarpus 441]
HTKSPVTVCRMGLFDLFRGSKKTSAILPTDIVVFIVGPSGSGKSWVKWTPILFCTVTYSVPIVFYLSS